MPEDKGKTVIAGYEFDLVKQGLDQDQVTKAISDLAGVLEACKKENAQLKNREDHLVSLSKLAEKVIIEADLVAADIKKDAENNARDMIKKASNEAQQASNSVLSQLKGISAHINSLVKNLEKSNSDPAVIEEFDEQDCEKAISDLFASANLYGLSDDELSHEGAGSNTEATLEIAPPVNIDSIMMAIRHLEAQPEVCKVELISRVDKPLIIVSLMQPYDIKGELEALPYIDGIEFISGNDEEKPVYKVSTKSSDAAGFNNY